MCGIRVALAAGLVALCGFASHSLGQNLFVINATGGGNNVSVGGDSIIDLVDSAVNTQDQFAPFQNTAATFNLNYGGITNAISISKNDSNTAASLTFGPTGVTRNFTAANQAELEQQIEDYLKKDAGSDLTDFLKAVNAQSVIAVSDGNPNATTARMAQWSYDRFGFHADQLKAYVVRMDNPVASAERQHEVAQGGGDDAFDSQNSPDSGVAAPILTSEKAGFQLFLGASGGTFEAGDFEGETATVFGSLDVNFTRRVGLSVGSFVAANTIGDAETFHAGATIGVPVRLSLPDGAAPLTWQLTPFAQLGGSGSQDIGAGGLIFGFGVANYLAWHVDDRWTLAMANQFSKFEGEKLEFDDFEIDPGVSQTMMKHGLRASYRFAESWYGYAGASYSAFLDDASIENWISPAVGLGYSSHGGSGFQVGGYYDTGDDYTAFGLRIAGNLVF
jgi:hypothetical protein